MDIKRETDLEATIAALLNSACAENESDTPDFILANYLIGCLTNFNKTVKARENWYGRPCGDGAAILGTSNEIEEKPAHLGLLDDLDHEAKLAQEKESDK